MAIEGTLQALLAALVSGRCYPVINTASVIVKPYITFQVITASEVIMVANSAEPEEMRVQIDIFADTYGAAKTLKAAVKAAMKTANFRNVPIMTQDLYEEVSKEYRQLMEYYIWS